MQNLSKVIAAIATGTPFVSDNPLSHINPFIRDSKPLADRLFEMLVDQPSECHECLRSKKKRAKFREFLIKNHAEENLSFWVAIEQFKHLETVEERKQQCVPLHSLDSITLSLSLSLQGLGSLSKVPRTRSRDGDQR